MRTVVVTLLALLALSGCGSVLHPNDVGWCAGDDQRPWARMSQPPADADAMRRLADAHPNYTFKYRREVWLTLPAGDVMLCRLDRPIFCSQEWWTFERSSGGPRLLHHDGMLCVPGDD